MLCRGLKCVPLYPRITFMNLCVLCFLNILISAAHTEGKQYAINPNQ